jgi:hypothetical protein
MRAFDVLAQRLESARSRHKTPSEQMPYLQTRHQTVRLSRGNHRSPKDGACVMELASLLAGERFSDHPQSVCSVIGGFLRGYNDWIDDRRRQDLYAYASRVVGTAQSKEVQDARAQRCLEWYQHAESRHASLTLKFRLHGRKYAWQTAGAWAAHRVARKSDDQLHQEALQLIDELIEMGRPSPSNQEDLRRRAVTC